MVDVVVENVGEKRAGATKRMRIVRRVKTGGDNGTVDMNFN